MIVFPCMAILNLSDRNSHGGGVMAYVKSDILRTRRLDLEVAGIEIMCLDISLCNSKTLLLGVCYQPPNFNVTQKQNFIDCLSTPINASLHDASKIALLAGNFNNRSVDKPLHLSELFRFHSPYGFDQLIVSPTRTSSTLDWFAIDNISLVLDSGHLPPLNILDHSLIFTTLNCLLPNSPPSSKLLWVYANADFTNLHDALVHVPWEDIHCKF